MSAVPIIKKEREDDKSGRSFHKIHQELSALMVSDAAD
jgi:hypothetical protein